MQVTGAWCPTRSWVLLKGSRSFFRSTQAATLKVDLLPLESFPPLCEFDATIIEPSALQVIRLNIRVSMLVSLAKVEG